MAYIETSNLDGETNLKLKQAAPETANCDTDDEIRQLRGECEAEAPTIHLYEFYGNIEVKDASQRDNNEGYSNIILCDFTLHCRTADTN